VTYNQVEYSKEVLMQLVEKTWNLLFPEKLPVEPLNDEI